MVAVGEDMSSNHLVLAETLIKAIDKAGELSIDRIDAGAVKRGISMTVLDRALEVLHRNKHIKRTTKKGTIYYSIKVAPKPKDPGSHLTWLREHYPPMTEENNGSGIDVDFSYLFLKPDEMKEYKAAAKGMPVHMIKDYGKKRS